MRTSSVFYPPALVAQARANIARDAWAAGLRDRTVEAARPWLEMSDDALWSLMFGPALRRSWMVWSSGHCPSCGQAVPMYAWEIDALARPWKARCPHCGGLFPKNDFAAFHASGLDARGVFDPALADRSLLHNAEHPDPSDPLHRFGVDDGDGYAEGDKRWWFVATYLIYGQWKQLVWGGICKLSAAWLLTAEDAYARKAGVLLDRVADVYPGFDFKTQGVMYEGPAHAGYVSTWHDACEETRELALAYDRVAGALRRDQALADFLAAKARRHGIAQPKAAPGDVCANIERGILRDALANPHKIHSNYPRTEITLCVLETVLGWPDNRADVFGAIDAIVEQATAVDGVTGEKGLAGYSSFTIQGLAIMLALFAQVEPGFLGEMLRRHPRLRDTYRFHIDTWCWQRAAGADGAARDLPYYPQAGDSSAFAETADQYVGVAFQKDHGLAAASLTASLSPSMFSFLWQWHGLTGDPAYVQALARANGGSVEGLPYDLFAGDAQAVRDGVRDALARHGPVPAAGSVDKRDWHIAVLRSPSAIAWLKYDTGLRHGHEDGLNLGLFAQGLDLMPDFGYPPVHRGGWSGANFDWYVGTLSHNTVVVDGRRQTRERAGRTTLWRIDDGIRLLRVSAPELYDIERYARTIALIDISDTDAYLVDVFRVAGGSEHTRFTHSHFGRITPRGLSLRPGPDYGHGALMRHFEEDPAPQPGWSVDWAIEDRRGYLPPGSDVHLRLTDVAASARARLAEAWVSLGGFQSNDDAWIPRVAVTREGAAPLRSTFACVVEPYAGRSAIASIRRLPAEDGEDVVLEVRLADGRRDVFIDRPAPGSQDSMTARWTRYDAGGRVLRAVACGGLEV